MSTDSSVNNVRRRLFSAFGAASVCLFSLQVLASANVDVDCPESMPDGLDVTTVAAPSLRPAAADREELMPPPDVAKDAIEKAMPDPRAVPSTTSGGLMVDDGPADDGANERRSELPPTATRLPGVADEDLPRFRRQMFRTDI